MIGYTSTAVNPVTVTNPASTGAAFYLWAAPRVLSWLGGHRRTEDLVTGVSFPGYDAQGNAIEWEDIYQYADFLWPDGEIPPGEPETIREERNVPMEPLRLFIVTPEGIQTGRADYEDTIGMWFHPLEQGGLYMLYDYALKNGELLQEVFSVEEADAIKQGLQAPVPFNPPPLNAEGLPVPPMETPDSGNWLWLGLAGLWAGRKWLGF